MRVGGGEGRAILEPKWLRSGGDPKPGCAWVHLNSIKDVQAQGMRECVPPTSTSDPELFSASGLRREHMLLSFYVLTIQVPWSVQKATTHEA